MGCRLLAIVSSLLLVACCCVSSAVAQQSGSSSTGWRAALIQSGFTTFKNVLETSGAATKIDALWDKPSLTFSFLAPSNAAFNALPDDVKAVLRSNPKQLRARLLYHIIPRRIGHKFFRTTKDGTRFTTLSGQTLYKVHAPIPEVGPSEAMYGPQFERPDAFVGSKLIIHGMSHVIDTEFKKLQADPLFGPFVGLRTLGVDGGSDASAVSFSDVLDALDREGLSEFKYKLDSHQLWDSIKRYASTSGVTLFAFQNGGSAKLPLLAKQLVKENPQRWISLLLVHVLPSSVSAEQFLNSQEKFKAINGQLLGPDDLAGIEIVKPNVIKTSKVSLHIINFPILPNSLQSQ